MGKVLSQEEWKDAKAPFVWCGPLDTVYKTWSDLEYEICLKWLEANADGWVYRYNSTFVFESDTDRTIFELWLEEGIANREVTGR